ncbi:unnamed protein product [Sympodiomycopsis kandeliae]
MTQETSVPKPPADLPVMDDLLIDITTYAEGSDASVYRCLLPNTPDFAEYKRIWSKKQINNESLTSDELTTFYAIQDQLKQSAHLVKVERCSNDSTTLHSVVSERCWIFSSTLVDMASKRSIARVKQHTDTEMKAFKTLKSVQGVHIPILKGIVSPNVKPESYHYKMILEDGGMTLYSLQSDYPSVWIKWQHRIYEQTEKALKACHDLGVCHNGVHGGNIIVHWTKKGKTGSEKITCPTELAVYVDFKVKVYFIDWSKATFQSLHGCNRRKDLSRLKMLFDD